MRRISRFGVRARNRSKLFGSMRTSKTRKPVLPRGGLERVERTSSAVANALESLHQEIAAGREINREHWQKKQLRTGTYHGLDPTQVRELLKLRGVLNFGILRTPGEEPNQVIIQVDSEHDAEAFQKLVSQRIPESLTGRFTAGARENTQGRNTHTVVCSYATTAQLRQLAPLLVAASRLGRARRVQ